MESGYLKLKEQIESTKFGVVLPADKQLYYWVGADNRIFALHPTHDNVYMRVAKTNIKERKPFSNLKK